MQIVIDIPEELYKNVVERTKMGYVGSDVWIAVANGKPLPKGHGRLIDVDALREDFKTSRKITFAELLHIACIVDHAPIIIEADKESEADK